MTKRKLLIPVMIAGILLMILVVGIGILLSKGYRASTGVYMESKDGATILIREKTPILLSSNHNGDMFDGIKIGEKILVIHTGIEESYPARTGAYAVFKINDGTTGAIPPSVIDELTKLGWLEEAEDVGLETPSGESGNDVDN